MATLEIVQIEKELLATLLNDGSKLDLGILKLQPIDFTHPHARTIFTLMQDLYKNKKIINQSTLTNLITAKNLNECQRFLDELELEYKILTDFEQHLELVKDYSRKRQFDALMKKFIDNPYQLAKFDEDIVAFRNTFNDIAAAKNSHTVTPIATVIETVTQQEQSMLDKNNTNYEGVTTGYKEIDAIFHGFQPGTLHLLGARPGQGKTAFALNLLLNVAKTCYLNNLDKTNEDKQDVCLFFSLEMNNVELANRMISRECMVTYNLSNPNFINFLRKNPDKAEVVQAQKIEIAHLPINLVDNVNDLNQIFSIARELSATKNIKLIIIDYAQKINIGNLNKSFSRTQEVNQIAIGLKNMAKSLNTVIYALAQVSREVDQLNTRVGLNTAKIKTENEPELSHLRESAGLEQEADSVAFLHYIHANESEKDDHIAFVKYLVKKNRNGEVGFAYLSFDKRYSRFDTTSYQNYSLQKEVEAPHD
ncbi:MAG: AAA family ATPase [Mycoplasmataceae bacterium]|jgi:replicative DNA helicase|nr:AAA family ATPase [Mycoplasmataceae bacterium]